MNVQTKITLEGYEILNAENKFRIQEDPKLPTQKRTSEGKRTKLRL
jgi:hypothetical protein